MNRIKFSIVIPTRNRHETLKYTLKTCVNQSFEDYEIIVCDNFSSWETKNVVEEMSSPKIRYIRTHKPLAMSSNWEFAVSQARGEYVTVVGSDDGLLQNTLSEVDNAICKTKSKVVRWEKISYRWPDVSNAHLALSASAGSVGIPMVGASGFLDSLKIISKVVNFELDYNMLPSFYNSFIHESLIKELIDRTGCIFASLTPDIYSGFAFAYLSKTYLSLGYPLGINGGSAKSNGIISTLVRNSSSGLFKEFWHLSKDGGFTHHPTVPNLPNLIATAIAEPFQQVRDRLFPHDSSLVIDRRGLIESCLNQTFVENNQQFETVKHALRMSVSDSQDLSKWLETKLDGFTPSVISNDSRLSFLMKEDKKPSRFDGKYIQLNSADVFIPNVSDLAHLWNHRLVKDHVYNFPKISSGIPGWIDGLICKLNFLQGKSFENMDDTSDFVLTNNNYNNYKYWIDTLTKAQRRLYYKDQTPESLSILAKLVHEYQPSKIIELGSLFGLSLRTWLSAKTTAEIIAIDLSFDYLRHSQKLIPTDMSQVTFLEQDILKTDFDELWSEDDCVLLYIDAHDQPNVPIMSYILAYAVPHLPANSIVVVDDLWYSPDQLDESSAINFFDKVVHNHMDPLHPLEASYAPYWKGGSFLGFMEVIPLMEWVNNKQVDLHFKPSLKSAYFTR